MCVYRGSTAGLSVRLTEHRTLCRRASVSPSRNSAPTWASWVHSWVDADGSVRMVSLDESVGVEGEDAAGGERFGCVCGQPTVRSPPGWIGAARAMVGVSADVLGSQVCARPREGPKLLEPPVRSGPACPDAAGTRATPGGPLRGRSGISQVWQHFPGAAGEPDHCGAAWASRTRRWMA